MSPIRFTELFAQVVSLWPAEIDIADGKLIGKSGGDFPTLNLAWREATDLAEKYGELHGVAVWAIYSDLHRRARASLYATDLRLRPSDCSVREIERRLAENLNSSTAGLEHLREQYVNDLLPH